MLPLASSYHRCIELHFGAYHFKYRVLQPLCTGGLVSYYADGQNAISKFDAYIYALGIVLCSLIMFVSFHSFKLWIYGIATKYRVACSGLVYEKIFTLNQLSADDGLSGRVINIISNDLARIEPGLSSLNDVWKGPLQVLIFGYIIYLEIGVAGLIGMLFLTSFIPLQGKGRNLSYFYCIDNYFVLS